MTLPSIIAESEYVALTTFRRTGEPVTTPVWIAADGDALVVTTTSTTGKVKRLRNSPRVTMQPCSRTGEIDPSTSPVEGVAVIVEDEAGVAAGGAALHAKYGAKYTAVTAIGKVARRSTGERVILRISAA